MRQSCATVIFMTTWMTKKEAAAHLRVSTRTIERLVRDGKLRKHNVAGSSRSVRFSREEVESLLPTSAA
jgi:excisionase family DNA binding protein